MAAGGAAGVVAAANHHVVIHRAAAVCPPKLPSCCFCRASSHRPRPSSSSTTTSSFLGGQKQLVHFLEQCRRGGRGCVGKRSSWSEIIFPRAMGSSASSPQTPDSGFQVLCGKVMREVGVEVVGLGALKLTGFLREQMQQRSLNFESLYTVRTLKEKLCYVAADYDVELRKDTQASCEVAGEGLFTLSKERFQTGEILFQPQIGGVCAMSLHRAVALCMDHCADAEIAGDDGWYKTVVLTGGTSCLPGLPERLEKELFSLLPSSISEGIKVIPPPYGVDSAWFGAKILSNVLGASHTICSKYYPTCMAPSFGTWEAQASGSNLIG
ncbi:hypothetical protein Taro_012287 [Colocasia esculenta]|uniref:Actin-related protein 8 n=1 Tax=Colocasia esculenta TaxID=4460 RepID=A0A843UF80_COLES|nr:hypothetical protein [Colocasia esculenta]